jgi:hypothetical protein
MSESELVIFQQFLILMLSSKLRAKFQQSSAKSTAYITCWQVVILGWRMPHKLIEYSTRIVYTLKPKVL